MKRRRSLLRQAFTMRSQELGRKVVSGASYQFIGMTLRTIITIGSTAVLARLLAPSDFGYVVMATVVTEFAALFSNFGFNNLLIQRVRVTRLQVDTIFWASVALGAILAASVFAASFFARWLFGDAFVGEMLRILCISFLLGSLGTIPGVVLARLMRFGTQFIIQTTAVLIRAAVAVALAYAGAGVWSLVAGAITGVALQAALLMLAVPFAPRFRFQSTIVTSTWRTSGSYFGGGLIYYANMNLDLLLIGRQLGPTALGHYQTARSLTDEIRSRIAVPLQNVLFPAFSAVQTDRARIQAIVVNSGRLLAAIVIPMGVGVSAVAPELVPVLYGPQWLSMIPLVAIFGCVAAIKASTAILSPLFNAVNRVELGFKHALIGCALTLSAIALTVRFGNTVVAWALLVASLYDLFLLRVAFGLIGLTARHILVILGPPCAAAASMWLAIACGRAALLPIAASSGVALTLFVLLGAAVYVGSLNLISRQYLADIKALLRTLREKPV